MKSNSQKSKVEIYLLDEENDMTLVCEKTFDSSEISIFYEMKVHSTILVKVTG